LRCPWVLLAIASLARDAMSLPRGVRKTVTAVTLTVTVGTG
jgi:hypothetical protein